MILIFSLVSTANVKDNGLLPLADGLTPPITKPLRRNSGLFGVAVEHSK